MKILGLKQKESNDVFLQVEEMISNLIGKPHIDSLIEKTADRIRKEVSGKNWGIAWSGGKDSVALELVCRQVGEHPSCMGMTDDLEYPEFLRFVTDNMPKDLVVYNSGHTLRWLSENLEWLFPRTSKEAAKWFKSIQHNAQNNFWKDKKLDILLTGRRKLDMNYCGDNGLYRNKNTNVLRYSPIHDWTHEEVLAAMYYYNLPRAPFYDWPNGFVVGSGCWPARQWTGSIEDGWRQIYEIDPSIVMVAKDYIKSAEDYVRSLGL